MMKRSAFVLPILGNGWDLQYIFTKIFEILSKSISEDIWEVLKAESNLQFFFKFYNKEKSIHNWFNHILTFDLWFFLQECKKAIFTYTATCTSLNVTEHYFEYFTLTT
jgi:hypothetical protein